MIQALHDRLQEYIDGQHIAGAAVRVRRGGEIIHEEYIGLADILNGKPVDANTVFRMASMTKPVIAVAVMMLAERGLLSITDDIAKYIPEFSGLKVAKRQIALDAKDIEQQADAMEYEPLKRGITIEDLLRHRSGMGHGALSFTKGVLETRPGMTLIERCAKIASCPLDFQPGASAGYSAVTAFDVLGRILEVASGKELEALLNELIFVPLGMKDTTFRINEAVQARVPRLYKRENEKLIDTAEPGVFSNPLGFDFPCGSAGLYSTLEDYDRFTLMLAQNGKYGDTELLKPETVKAMASTSPEDPALTVPAPTWGLGMCVFEGYGPTDRYLTKGTFGWSGAFGTHFYIDPAKDVCMTLMVNRADIGGAGSYVSFGVEKMIYKALCAE